MRNNASGIYTIMVKRGINEGMIFGEGVQIIWVGAVGPGEVRVYLKGI